MALQSPFFGKRDPDPQHARRAQTMAQLNVHGDAARQSQSGAVPRRMRLLMRLHRPPPAATASHDT
jgi:hypothetical protein